MSHGLTKDGTPITLTVREANLIAELRKTPYSKVEITLRKGEPTRIEVTRESIEL